MSWTRHRLKDVARVSVSNVDKKSADGEVPVRLINYTDVYYGDRITPSMDLMEATATLGQLRAFRLRPGDVLITKDSETAEDIGVAAFLDATADDLVLGYHLALLRPRPGWIDGRFLYWAMCSDVARGQLSAAATGITRFGLRTDAISSLGLFTPALNVQRAIADYLDAETARIDALIKKKRRMVDLLEEKENALLSDLLVPPDIRRARLGYFARVQSGITVDQSRSTEGATIEHPYLRVANVQAGWLDLSTVSSITVPKSLAVRSTLRVGDVLMTEGGDLDKLGRGTIWLGEIKQCLHQNHVFAVRPKSDVLDPEYLALLTRTAHARRYFESTGVQTTNLASTSSAKILGLPIPTLPLHEQKARIQLLRSAATPLQKAVARIQRQLKLLAEHRQALITAAVTGELEVPGAAA